MGDAGLIRKKFDAIIEFSGIAEFLDTPVKRYSSGMNACSASRSPHTSTRGSDRGRSLAVGDFRFRSAFGRIRQLVTSGIPVVVVSHQLDRIASLCTVRSCWSATRCTRALPPTRSAGISRGHGRCWTTSNKAAVSSAHSMVGEVTRLRRRGGIHPGRLGRDAELMNRTDRTAVRSAAAAKWCSPPRWTAAASKSSLPVPSGCA
jgi:hypothetical protein